MYEEVRLSIIKNIRLKGECSVSVTDEYAFKLADGRYLETVTGNNLIDQFGYEYSFSVLSYEEICSLADFLNN